MSADEVCPRCGSRYPTARLGACPRCLLAEDAGPETVGGALELEAEIGRGGMGTVYRARHRKLGRTVAVKFLPEALAAQPEFRARFEREARALAMLNHPHIVAVHDFGEDEGQPYIVMEYVDGRPLSAVMPLPPDRAADVARQVCGALAYAHARGVIHRDIKPENILVDAAGRVKVTDFGIARIVGSGDTGGTLTATGEAFGTPHYVAPEALQGAAPDPRMDVYSVGVLIYQMLTNRLPVGHFDPPPPPFDRVVLRALSHDPSRRQATAEELGRDLAALTESPPPSLLRELRGTSRLSSGGAAAGAPATAGDSFDSASGGPFGPARGELPPDERMWMRAVALLQSISTAVAIWSFVECVRPKVIERRDEWPLTTLATETLPDGRILAYARFEMWPAIATLATFAVAITAYGFLRRHWRLSGLERPDPDRRIPESRMVFWFGIGSIFGYALLMNLAAAGVVEAARYSPVVGGPILVATLYFLWVSILSAWRVSRPLRREPWMWLGFGLANVPPTLELVRYMREWHP